MQTFMEALLPFHRRMVQELIETDGLCVMAPGQCSAAWTGKLSSRHSCQQRGLFLPDLSWSCSLSGLSQAEAVVPGLGWQKVVAVILRLQLERLKSPEQQGAVLVLGCTDWQRKVLRGELQVLEDMLQQASIDGQAVCDAAALPSSSDTPLGTGGLKSSDLPMEITNETPSAARTELYQTRGCLFVTTRILVVDFLNARLRSSQVAGIIVLNAHRVTDTSGEGFAVRLFRTSNTRGFVRAFSDNPASVTGGFAKVHTPSCCSHAWQLRYAAGQMHGSPGMHIVGLPAKMTFNLTILCGLQTEKIMKALFIRRLYIWPRWEAQVKDVLSGIGQGIEVTSPVHLPSCLLMYHVLHLKPCGQAHHSGQVAQVVGPVMQLVDESQHGTLTGKH